MVRSLIVIVILLSFVRCRKDPKLNGLPINDLGTYCFDESSHLAQEPILKELYLGLVIGGPYYTILGPSFVYSLKFNPENANQIIYVKSDSGATPLYKTIWFYDFCTKESRQIAAQSYNDLSWGSGDKILYTGLSHEVYMMNSWGEDVQQITSSETYQHIGKFSPNGNFFFTTGSDGLRVFDINGNEIIFHEGYPPFKEIDWIDNDHLLVMNNSTSIYQSFNIYTGDRINLHTQALCHYCNDTYVRSSHIVYFIDHRYDKTKGLYSFDLAKDQLTYLKELSSSYMYRSIDYNNDAKKLIFTLHEYSWKDSVKQEIYLRNSAIMLNENGTNPRILELPF
ncbi:MAG: hypothetical protein ACI8ZM_002873 [Crocinitomix sp.]|jgi:hypothetical protein